MSTTRPVFEKRHPIQVVARRSGLSQELLRAWERRYQVVRPDRSPGGRRLYSDGDVERLRLVKRAVDGGRRISDVAGLSHEELTILAQEDRVEALGVEESGIVGPLLLLDCLEAIRRLDGPGLEHLLHRELLANGGSQLIEGLVAPLMVEIGRLWHDDELGASHEHLATGVLLGLTSRILADSQPRSPVGTIVVATTAQQRHEVGSLLAAATAAQEGWRVVYLGSDLPSQEIVAACRKVGAEGLALGFTYLNDSLDDFAEIRSVVSALAGDLESIIGGAAAIAHRAELTGLGATVVDDLGSFRALLRRISGAGDPA